MPTTDRTDAEWRAVAEGLPGWAAIEYLLGLTRLPIRPIGDVRTRGLITDFCEQKGWLCGIDHRPGEPGTYRARYLLPEPDGRMGVTPMHRAATAVHAIILAAEARHRVDPARGWC